MDSVDHPLDWWAYGGYREVMRQLDCDHAHARRKVKHKLRSYFQRTGDPLWRPIGNRGHAQLRRAILNDQTSNDELT